MAMKLDAGDYSRSEVYAIFPENIVVEITENSRESGVPQEAIEALADSILANGQLQPVVVRKIDGNRVQLVSGYGRHRAVTHINTWLQPENPMKLQCIVRTMNAEEAFLHNIVENLDRCATTPIDDAHAQRRLREQYGWTEFRIAEFYKKSVSYIYQLKKTLILSEPIKEAVAEGNLSIGAALDLTEIPEAQREAVLASATNPETGKASSEVVADAVREHKEKAGKKGSKARTLKQVKGFFEEQTGPAEGAHIKALAEAVLRFISGRIGDKGLFDALKKNCRE